MLVFTLVGPFLFLALALRQIAGVSRLNGTWAQSTGLRPCYWYCRGEASVAACGGGWDDNPCFAQFP
jgi:hypothetical protein